MTIEYKIDEFELEEPNDDGAEYECKGRQVKVSCQGDIAVMPFFPDENTHGIGWLLLQQRDDVELDKEVPYDGAIDLEKADGVLIGFENPRSIDVFLEALSAMQEKFEGSSRWAPLAEVIEERRLQDAEWGGPDHDDHHDFYDWWRFIKKQLRKAKEELSTGKGMIPEKVRQRLVKIAALATAAIEVSDRQSKGDKSEEAKN